MKIDLTQFVPRDGKGWNYFAIASLPVLIAGILNAADWRHWAALPLQVILAGLTATRAYHAQPPEQPADGTHGKDGRNDAPADVDRAVTGFQSSPTEKPTEETKPNE